MSTLHQAPTQDIRIPKTNLALPLNMPVCQTDYPLDWYQEDFIPYAEEYLALPDRRLASILPWMRRYIEPALTHFGDKLLLLAHYYMGGDIVNLVKLFGGHVGDSYQLALMAVEHPEKKLIVESAVHFMAESISILAHPDQRVFITNPKAGCTMEMHAKDYMLEPMLEELNDRYGQDRILPICYMNTSGRIKAMTGAQNGAVCTSSNVERIFKWALSKNKKIVFIPDRNMGENVASWVGIAPTEIAYWPAGDEATQYQLSQQNDGTQQQFDQAKLIIFSSYCSVHSFIEPAMVEYWQQKDFHVVVHPECTKVTVDAADSCGSTAFIYNQVFHDLAHTKKYAIGTENHMVRSMQALCQPRGIEVIHVANAPLSPFKTMGCGCATMSRNDPPHLVATLDLLRQGKNLDYNEVKPGDVLNEFTGTRHRLTPKDQQWIVDHAKIALENMIRITEDH